MRRAIVGVVGVGVVGAAKSQIAHLASTPIDGRHNFRPTRGIRSTPPTLHIMATRRAKVNAAMYSPLPQADADDDHHELADTSLATMLDGLPEMLQAQVVVTMDTRKRKQARAAQAAQKRTGQRVGWVAEQLLWVGTPHLRTRTVLAPPVECGCPACHSSTCCSRRACRCAARGAPSSPCVRRSSHGSPPARIRD